MLKLDGQKHVAASSVILLALLALFYTLIIHPAISGRIAAQDRFAELQFQFNKLGDVESKSNELKEELKQLRGQETDETGFLAEKPEALAAADLQKHIKTLIESSEGNLISTQVVQQKEVGVFPKVTVKVHLRGNIETLRNTLYRFNTEFPVLLIDNLLIQQRHSATGRRARRGADQLEVRFDVTGFIYQVEAS